MIATQAPTVATAHTATPHRPTLIELAHRMAYRPAGAFKFQVLIYNFDRSMTATAHYCPGCLPHVPYRYLAEIGVTVSVSRVADYHACYVCGHQASDQMAGMGQRLYS